MALSQAQIKTAAKWWAEKLRNPTFSALSNDERRSGESAAVEMAELLAAKSHQDPGADGAARFETALARLLGETPNMEGQYLRVDYDPDHLLSQALEGAGLYSGKQSLPWKTVMEFRSGGVQVKCGYGAPYEDVPLIVEGQA